MARIDDDRRRRLLVDRHLLARSERSERTVVDVVGALALLHSTDPSTPHLSVHARSDATPDDVDAAFYDDRALLRHTTIRRTVFAMPLDVVALAHGAYNAPLVAKLRAQLARWIDSSPETDRDATSFLAAAERDVVAALRRDGPMTGNDLASAVPALQLRFEPAPGTSYSKPMRITSKVLEVLAAEGRIARGRPTGGSFTSASWTWASVDDWLGDAGIEHVEPDDALDGLLERHLMTFAPATVTDLAWWTGLPKGRIRASLVRLAAVEVMLDSVDEAGFVLDGDHLDAPTIDDVVALLPGLDSTTMGWKQRAWYVDDDPAAQWFDRNGNAGPTVWLDGRVIGAWTQRPDGEVVTDVADPGLRRLLAPELERTATWLGDVRVRWRYPTGRAKRLAATVGE